MVSWKASLSRKIKRRGCSVPQRRLDCRSSCMRISCPNLGGAALASEFSALSADHLEHTDPAGVAAMARAGTVAVLLPGAFYFIRETTKPPVELFRAHGVNMALATDCNPGSSAAHVASAGHEYGRDAVPDDRCRMPLRCERGKVRGALGILGETGTLEAGKRCDLAIWDIDRPAELNLPDGLQPVAAAGCGWDDE